MHRNGIGFGGRAGSIQRRHRERVGRVGGKIGHAIDGAGGGRDLMAVLEDRVAGDDAVAGHARCVPGQDRSGARRGRGRESGRHARKLVRCVGRRDDRPRLASARAAVVVGRIGALRPPVGFVGDAVFHHRHAGGVDAVRQPRRRAALRRHGVNGVRRQVGDRIGGAGGRRDLVAVLENRVTGDHPAAGHA